MLWPPPLSHPVQAASLPRHRHSCPKPPCFCLLAGLLACFVMFFQLHPPSSQRVPSGEATPPVLASFCRPWLPSHRTQGLQDPNPSNPRWAFGLHPCFSQASDSSDPGPLHQDSSCIVSPLLDPPGSRTDATFLKGVWSQAFASYKGGFGFHPQQNQPPGKPKAGRVWARIPEAVVASVLFLEARMVPLTPCPGPMCLGCSQRDGSLMANVQGDLLG